MIKNKPLLDKYDLSSVRSLFTGAAPLGLETAEQLYEQYPKWFIRQGYGKHSRRSRSTQSILTLLQVLRKPPRWYALVLSMTSGSVLQGLSFPVWKLRLLRQRATRSQVMISQENLLFELLALPWDTSTTT